MNQQDDYKHTKRGSIISGILGMAGGALVGVAVGGPVGLFVGAIAGGLGGVGVGAGVGVTIDAANKLIESLGNLEKAVIETKDNLAEVKQSEKTIGNISEKSSEVKNKVSETKNKLENIVNLSENLAESNSQSMEIRQELSRKKLEAVKLLEQVKYAENYINKLKEKFQLSELDDDLQKNVISDGDRNIISKHQKILQDINKQFGTNSIKEINPDSFQKNYNIILEIIMALGRGENPITVINNAMNGTILIRDKVKKCKDELTKEYGDYITLNKTEERLKLIDALAKEADEIIKKMISCHANNSQTGIAFFDNKSREEINNALKELSEKANECKLS